MADGPPSLPLPGGRLPPAPLLLRWLERLTGDRVRCARLPLDNASLPDLLRLGGVRRLDIEDAPRPSFRWEGLGGARVLACRPETDDDGEGAPLHLGLLAIDDGRDEDEAPGLDGLVDLARLEDAAAAVLPDGGAGASWDHILAATGMGEAPRLPLAVAAGLGAAGDGAWNPLPFTRRCIVQLPLGDGVPPWGLIDRHGARHSVQVVEGPLGRELLTTLDLDALEATPLRPIHDPVPGANWEIAADVLDNGLLRAEFDDRGQLQRLCCDGVFAELSGPALRPLLDGLPVQGPATITVLEDGPVRARIAVSIDLAPAGQLHLTCSLHEHEDCLRVSATWDGQGDLELDHPTAHRGGVLLAAGDLARAAWPQSASILHRPMATLPGLRWAALGDPGGRGLAIAAGRPLALRAEAGHLVLPVRGTVSYALCTARRPSDALPLPLLARSLTTPGRPYSGAEPIVPPFRLADPGGLVPLWFRRPAGWAGELLLADQAGRRGRALLLPTRRGGEAWRVDARGERIAPLPLSPENDGFVIDHAPNEVLVLRWTA